MPTRDDIQELLDADVCPSGKESEFKEFADMIIDVAKDEIREEAKGQGLLADRVARLEALYAPLQARDSDLANQIDSARKTATAIDNSLQRNIETNRKQVVAEFASLRNEIDARIDALPKAAPQAGTVPRWAQDIQDQVKDLNDAIGRLGQRVGALERHDRERVNHEVKLGIRISPDLFAPDARPPAPAPQGDREAARAEYNRQSAIVLMQSAIRHLTRPE